jgi:hypothetical protein
LDDDTIEGLEYLKGILDEHWEPLSHEMGLMSHSGYYGKDNPLIAMQTMNYEEVAKIIQSTPAYEDFNHDKKNNYRAADFDRKWNHTRRSQRNLGTKHTAPLPSACRN